MPIVAQIALPATHHALPRIKPTVKQNNSLKKSRTVQATQLRVLALLASVLPASRFVHISADPSSNCAYYPSQPSDVSLRRNSRRRKAYKEILLNLLSPSGTPRLYFNPMPQYAFTLGRSTEPAFETRRSPLPSQTQSPVHPDTQEIVQWQQ